MALPIVVASYGRAAQNLRIAHRPLGAIERSGHEVAGLFGSFDLYILYEVVNLVAQLLIENLIGGAVVTSIVEPGSLGFASHFARIGVMAQIEVNGSGDYEYIAHNAILNRRTSAAGADDVGVAKIKAIVVQNSLQAQCGVYLAHAGYVQRHAILNVQLVILKAADDFIFVAVLAIAIVIILRLAGEVAGHFAAFELRQDQRLDGDGLGQRKGRADDEQSGNEQSKQFLHG